MRLTDKECACEQIEINTVRDGHGIMEPRILVGTNEDGDLYIDVLQTSPQFVQAIGVIDDLGEVERLRDLLTAVLERANDAN